MSKRSVLDQGRSAQQLREDGTLLGMPVYHTLADAMDEISELRERIAFLQAEIDVLNGTACAEEQTRGKGPCGSCRTCRNERIEKLEAECEFVKAQKESLQRTAEFAVSLAEQFERAVASREPVSGMQVTPTGDFISAAQLPSVLKRMKWWAREIRKADAARAALGEVEREG